MSNEIVLNDDFYLKEYGWSKNQFEVVKSTYFKGLSEDDIKVFAHVCKHTKLDPFLKQIYPIVRGKILTIQTSIDGYRVIADRTNRYSPGRESTFVYKKDNTVLSATAYVKKMTADGTWHEVAATAHFDEYQVCNGPMWKKMPHTMIAKCAEALALRKAFPAEMSALRTDDEMDQADKIDKKHENEEIVVITKIAPKNIDDEDKIDFKKISVDQIKVLKELESQVDKQTVDGAFAYMKTAFNAVDYSQLPDKAFSGMENGYKKNIQKRKLDAQT